MAQTSFERRDDAMTLRLADPYGANIKITEESTLGAFRKQQHSRPVPLLARLDDLDRIEASPA